MPNLNGENYMSDCREELSFILREDFDTDVEIHGLSNSRYKPETENKILQRYTMLYDYLCLAFTSLSRINGFEKVFNKSQEIQSWLSQPAYRRDHYSAENCDLLNDRISIPEEVLWNRPMTSMLMLVPRIATREAALFEDGWYAHTHFKVRTSVLSRRIHKLYTGSGIYRYGKFGFKGFIEFVNRAIETKLGEPEVLRDYDNKYVPLTLTGDSLVVGGNSSDRYISRLLWSFNPSFKEFIRLLEIRKNQNGPCNFLQGVNMQKLEAASIGSMTLRRV
jgi:hypothetical protein